MACLKKEVEDNGGKIVYQDRDSVIVEGYHPKDKPLGAWPIECGQFKTAIEGKRLYGLD